MLKNLALFIPLCLIMMAASCARDATQEYGMVTGETLFVVMGHPGAITGKPDPDWEPPKDRPVGNVLILFLRTDAGGLYELFSTVSSDEGQYSIELPPGDYVIKCATEDHSNWEEAKGLGARRNDDEYKRERLRQVFDLESDDEGHDVYRGQGPVHVKAGETMVEDLAAVVLCVD